MDNTEVQTEISTANYQKEKSTHGGNNVIKEEQGANFKNLNEVESAIASQTLFDNTKNVDSASSSEKSKNQEGNNLNNSKSQANFNQTLANSNLPLQFSYVTFTDVGLLLPQYPENCDIKQWAQRVDAVQNAYNIPDNVMNIIAVGRLKGVAQTWFYSKTELMLMPWTSLKVELINKFNKIPVTSSLIVEFKNRKWRKKETFLDYYINKTNLGQCVGISESSMIESIIEGLPKVDLKRQKISTNYKSLQEIVEVLQHETRKTAYKKVVMPVVSKKEEKLKLDVKVEEILNKISVQQFEHSLSQMKKLNINTLEKAYGIVDVILKMNLKRCYLCHLFARLCSELASLRIYNQHTLKFVEFREILRIKFNLMLQSNLNTDPKFNVDTIPNIKLIVQLFERKLVTEDFINNCIDRLITDRNDGSLECLCVLLTSTREIIGNSKLQPVFKELKNIIDNDYNISTRVKCLIHDTIRSEIRNSKNFKEAEVCLPDDVPQIDCTTVVDQKEIGLKNVTVHSKDKSEDEFLIDFTGKKKKMKKRNIESANNLDFTTKANQDEFLMDFTGKKKKVKKIKIQSGNNLDYTAKVNQVESAIVSQTSFDKTENVDSTSSSEKSKNQDCSAKQIKNSQNKNIHVEQLINFSTMRLFRRVRRILNNITPETFDLYLSQFRKLEISTCEQLRGITDIIYESVITTPQLCVVYAQLCRTLAFIQVPSTKMEFANLRKLLVTRCQSEFEKHICVNNDEFKNPHVHLNSIDDNEMQMEFIAFITFIGELFLQKMLTVNIMFRCINHLLEIPQDKYLKGVCTLLAIIGKELISKHEDLSPVLEKMKNIIDQNEHKVSKKIIIMMQEIIVLATSVWPLSAEEEKSSDIVSTENEQQSDNL